MNEPTKAEEAARAQLLARHPAWKAELLQGWWSVRDERGLLLGRNRDIVIAGEIAEGRRRP